MNTVTITGRLGSDPELRFTPAGKAVCNIAVADSYRRKNEQTGQWEDVGETLWLRGSLWGKDAEDFAEKGRKGDKVVVIGRLTQRSWDDKQSGQKRTVVELAAQSAAIVPSSPAATRAPAYSETTANDPWNTGEAPF